MFLFSDISEFYEETLLNERKSYTEKVFIFEIENLMTIYIWWKLDFFWLIFS